MTLNEAYGWIIGGLICIMFLAWYVRCLILMLFVAQSVRSYFSMAYESSGPFAMANFIIAINAAAFGLYWLSQ